MSDDHGRDLATTPEQILAYLDGELDGERDAALIQRIEGFLAAHPEARAQAGYHRRLNELWRETSPDEPEPSAWEGVRSRLASAASRAPTPLPGRVAWIAAALLVASAALWFAAGPRQPHAPPELANGFARDDAGEVFEVARADEIEILRVEGRDTSAVLVGDHPRGPLELLAPGEAKVSSAGTGAATRQVTVRDGANARPMVWARVDAEMDDD